MATFPLFVVLGEGFCRERWPNWLEGFWMAAIVAGVMLVLTGKPAAGAWRNPGGSVFLAIVAGVLGAVGQGSGIVLAKLAGDASTAGGADPLSVTLVRMIAGFGGMVIVVGVRRALDSETAGRRRMTSTAFYLILAGAVLGPTLGVWLSMISIAHIDAGRASVLIALTPVLMLPIVWIGWGERPSVRGWVGTITAFVGTAGLLSGRG